MRKWLRSTHVSDVNKVQLRLQLQLWVLQLVSELRAMHRHAWQRRKRVCETHRQCWSVVSGKRGTRRPQPQRWLLWCRRQLQQWQQLRLRVLLRIQMFLSGLFQIHRQ